MKFDPGPIGQIVRVGNTTVRMAGSRGVLLKKKLPKLPEKLVAAGWKMEARVGGGGQGSIFLIGNPASPRKAALKLPKPGCSSTDLERFRREIRSLAAIKHQNVMSIVEFDADVATPWMVMPWGESLGVWWKQVRKPLAPAHLFDRAYECAIAILAGLSQFHERGETHRDLKPENIIVVDGVVKVSDAGIIFSREATRLTEHTNRPIRRGFHLYSYSSQNPQAEPPQWEDCLHFAWVFGWMLLDPPKPFGNFHWRYLSFVSDARCETVVRPLMAACSHERNCPANAGEVRRWLDHMMTAARRLNDLPAASAKVVEAEAWQRARTIIDRAERLEQAEAAAAVCERHIQPIREELWNVLRLALDAGADFKVEASTEPRIPEALVRLVENPMGSPNLLRYVFGGKGTDRMVVSMRCVTPMGIKLATFPDGYLPFVFDCHFEHPNQQKSQSFALLVHRDASLWRMQWPNLLDPRPTSTEEVLQWFLKVVSSPDLRPPR